MSNHKFNLTLDEDNQLEINNQTIPAKVLNGYGLGFEAKGDNTFLTVPTNGTWAVIPSHTTYWNYLCEDMLLDTAALETAVAA